MLDASDQSITLCWEREADVSVEEVQMKATTCTNSTDEEPQEGKREEGGGGGGGGGGENAEEVAPCSGSTAPPPAVEEGNGEGEGGGWVTLSKTLGSSALKKKKLSPGTAYVFRRRALKHVRVSW